jgi:hypothetical protein
MSAVARALLMTLSAAPLALLFTLTAVARALLFTQDFRYPIAAYYTDDILLFHVTSQKVSFSPHRFAVMRSQLTHHLAPSGAALNNSYKKMNK